MNIDLLNKIQTSKVLILDMDGIIVDTEPIHIKSFEVLIEEMGVSCSQEFLHSLVGFSVENNIETILKKYGQFNKNKYRESILKREEIYLRLLTSSSIKAIDGINNIIQICIKNNIKLALASSSSKEQINEVLKLTKLNHSFDCLVSGDDVEKKKPAPDIYLKVLSDLNINQKQCIAIEDSPSGVRSAKSAGLDCVGILNPFADKVALKEAKWILSSLTEVADIFKHAYNQ